MNLITEWDIKLNYNNSYLLRKLIVEIISELSDPIYTDVTSLRAQVAKSAADAAKIIIDKYPQWNIASMAKTGSRSADLILSDGKNTCQIEVKNYGRSDILKLEMSLVKKNLSPDKKEDVPNENNGEYTSNLSNLFGIAPSLGPTMKDIKDKLEFPNSNKNDIDALMKDITSALQSSDLTLISDEAGQPMQVRVVGNKSPRYISILPGNKGDWARVRHSRQPSGTKRRKIWTSTKSDVESRIKNKGDIDPQKLADAVIGDLEGNDYLLLMSSNTSGVIWRLGEDDPLGIGTPFTAASIDASFPPRFGTHGGEGDRPAVTIKLNLDTGFFLGREKKD